VVKKKYLKLLDSYDENLINDLPFEIGEEDELLLIPNKKSRFRDIKMETRDYPGISGYVQSTQNQERDFSGIGPMGYKRSDEKIYEDVCEELLKSSLIDASEIVVHVENGIVYLSGSIKDRRMKKMTENLVEDVAGVTDVRNNLIILKRHQFLKGSESVLGKDLGIN
jgi:hypothetical protein